MICKADHASYQAVTKVNAQVASRELKSGRPSYYPYSEGSMSLEKLTETGNDTTGGVVATA